MSAPPPRPDEWDEIDRQAKRAPPRKDATACHRASPDCESIPSPPALLPFIRARAARAEMREGGDINVMFTDLIHYLRARFQVEEGQTMAEYGVVLAVLALGVVVALGLLSGAISTAIDKVRAIL